MRARRWLVADQAQLPGHPMIGAPPCYCVPGTVATMGTVDRLP
jgi:hypothetical protein